MINFSIQWYENQEKRRRESYERGQISNINRQLQTILHRVEKYANQKVYQQQIEHIQRKLVSSDIWNLRYIINFENKEVALEQGVFLTLILHWEDSLKEQNYLKMEVDRLMRQLGDFDWSLYGEYMRRKQRILCSTKDDLTKVF